ncbi:MAG: DNA polymerase III subunit gamma/tau C-terminal domain-containing protein, partial [Cycloclasticus sp.]
ATTDPQKMPVTVLSRCLQFNLKRLLPNQIEGQLKLILESEGIEYQPQATELLARAADGSMRDGLSLLDQGIVHGNGVLNETDVIDMLGSVAREPVLDLLNALLTKQGADVLESIEKLDEFAPDYAEVLQSLLSYLHQIAVCQIAGMSSDEASLTTLAEQLSKEDVQLYYQIALIGQKDLPLAPTPKVGFEMVLLRMLAFAPVDMSEENPVQVPTQVSQPVQKPAVMASQPEATPAPTAVAAAPRKAPKLTIPEKKTLENTEQVKPKPVVAVKEEIAQPLPKPAAVVSETVSRPDNKVVWHELVPTLGLDPMTLQLANNATLVTLTEHECELMLISGHVSLNKKSEQHLKNALSDYFGRRLELKLIEGAKDIVTPNSIASDKVADRQRLAEQEVMNNPMVKQIIEVFDAKIIDGSIKPID